jgi:hypothetical protein
MQSISHKRVFTFLALSALILGVGLLIGVARRAPRYPGMAIRAFALRSVHAGSIPAFTVEMVETLTTGPGGSVKRNAEVTGKLIFARRSDGATVEQFVHTGMLLPSGKITPVYDESTVRDPGSQTILEKHNFLNTTSTYKYSADEFRKKNPDPPTPESNCLLRADGTPDWVGSAKYVGTEQILGYTAAVIELAESNSKYWIAPALGCRLLGSEHTFLNKKNEITSINRQMASRITLGEPSPSLFAAVGDEVKPSEVYARKVAAWGLDPSYIKQWEARSATQDAAYALHRK